jgi:hypothetical protein
MHVAAITGSAAPNGKGNWRATVVITVHDSNNQGVANATVTGSWSVGGTATCVTGTNGQCSVTSPKLSNSTSSVSFTVSNVARANSTYPQPATAPFVVVNNK